MWGSENQLGRGVSLLTGLLKAGFDPLREPAHFTVTVEGVGAESPGETHKCWECDRQHLRVSHTDRQKA